MRRWVVVVVVVGVAACGQPSPTEHQTPSYLIDPGGVDIGASPLHPRTLVLSGAPFQQVEVKLDRSTAGTLDVSSVELDSSGAGVVVFTPCYHASPACLGSLKLSMEDATAPGTAIADADVNLVTPPIVGDISACQTTSNVFHLKGNDFILNGEHETAAGAPWFNTLAPDTMYFSVTDTDGSYTARFSLIEIPHSLVPGIYEGARRETSSIEGHPGLEINTPGNGCNELAGRFQIHTYEPDPQTGVLGSVTISFEQFCDPPSELPTIPKLVEGCIHFEEPLPASTTPPAPDPTKVSVQAIDRMGIPDPTARMIFTAPDGSIVLDTTGNAFGQAEASMPSGGTLTVIQTAGGGEDIRSWRGVSNGNHFVTRGKGPTFGVRDDMLVTHPTPPNTSVGVMTSCGGATPRLGHPGYAILPFYDGCRAPTFDMLAIATPQDASAQRQFIWQTNVPHVPYGNATVSGTWTPYSTATVTLTNVPDPSPAIGTTWATMLGATELSEGQRIDVPVAGTNQLSFSYPSGAGSKTIITATTYNGPISELRTAVYTQPPSNVTFDFAAQPVPKFTALKQTPTGVTWSQTAGTADVRTIYWQALAPSIGGVTWIVVEPNDGQTTMTLPAIPAVHAALDPTKDPDALAAGISIIYDDYDVVTGYALFPPTGDYRQHTSVIELHGSHPFDP